jgi:hypothetical protein
MDHVNVNPVSAELMNEKTGGHLQNICFSAEQMRLFFRLNMKPKKCAVQVQLDFDSQMICNARDYKFHRMGVIPIHKIYKVLIYKVIQNIFPTYTTHPYHQKFIRQMNPCT